MASRFNNSTQFDGYDGFEAADDAVYGDGDPYCPVEQRRRGPMALIASMAVMLGGGAFLLSAVMSEPNDVDAEAQAAGRVVIAIDQDAVRLADAPSVAIAAETRDPSPVADPIADMIAVADRTDDGEDGLSPRLNPRRLAASDVASGDPDPADRAAGDDFAPRLKPTLDVPVGDAAERGFAPRLNPRRAAATERHAAAAVARPVAPVAALIANPARSTTLASADDGPPPVFFEADLSARAGVRTPAAIAFAGDIADNVGEAKIRIVRGENFVDALARAGVRAEDRNAAAYAFGEHYNLRRLRPGQELELALAWPNQTLFQLASADAEPAAHLVGLDFRVDAENRISLRRVGGALVAETTAVPLTTRMMAIAGAINGSLYVSAKREGAPDEVIAGLADAFAYDVDFQREIFGGDEYEAVFEVKYDDQGEIVSAGDILYARLKWRGRAREKGYYRFASAADGDRADFYDATGQSAKRLLMKTPIDGARLSSGFGTRKHPILGYRKAHKGVDFAASRGTPIKAAGDGVVERADRYGSFGNYVRIRHANGYQTAYAHLNGFARGMRKGKRVRQGDIIGYVGTTGRSTGPHLHYEVHLNGAPVNPQKLKIATGKQLEGADLARFKAERDRINALRMAAFAEPAPDVYARDDREDESAL